MDISSLMEDTMKKTLKKLLIAFIVLLGVASLTSCNHANTYNKFHNNSSNLAKSHVLKEVSVSDVISLQKKLAAGKNVKGSKTTTVTENDKTVSYTYIYIFLGTPTNSTASTDAQIFDEQAKQYEIDCLYWLDSDLSDSKLKKFTDNVKIASFKSGDTALISFRVASGSNAALVSFDSTSVVCNKKDGTASGTELTPYQIAQNCFKNLTTVISKNADNK